MKTSKVTGLVAWAMVLGAACSVGGCAAGTDDVGEPLAGDESLGSQSEALSKCGQKPQTTACKIATCDGERWSVHNRPNGYACNDDCGTGTCEAGKCSSRLEGTAHPNYYVLGVVYSPPGTEGGGSLSNVSYGIGSSAGTNVSTSKSFKAGVTVSAEVNAWGGSASANAGFAYTRTSESTISVTKKQDYTIADPGGVHDGIDHDRDAIWLWLNPSANVSVCGEHADWQFSTPDDEQMEVQYVYVRDLKNPALMPPGVKDALTAHGITPALYPQILQRDSFANGPIAIDPQRFVKTTTTFPYEPPFEPGDAPLSSQLILSNETSSSQTSGATSEYTVGCSWEGKAAFFAKVKASTQFTWTNTKTSTSSSTASETATVKVTGPSFGYTGPTNIAVYFDTLYKTFLFVPISYAPTVTGVATNAAGQALVNEPITLQIGGATYNTVTGQNGAYKFFDVPSGTAAVEIRGARQYVAVAPVFTPLPSRELN